jgi:Cu2+-containing amine oxidase
MTTAAVSKPTIVDNLFKLVSRQAPHVPVVASTPSLGHPLDPLSAAEVSAAGKACRHRAEELGVIRIRFNSIALEVVTRLLLRYYALILLFIQAFI